MHEVKRLIQIGIGIGFLPTVVAAEAITAGELWPMLHPNILPTYPVYLITRDEGLTPPARALLDTIEMHVNDLDDEEGAPTP